MGRRAKFKHCKLEVASDLTDKAIWIYEEKTDIGITWDYSPEGAAAAACYLLDTLGRVTGIETAEILRIVNSTHTPI